MSAQGGDGGGGAFVWFLRCSWRRDLQFSELWSGDTCILLPPPRPPPKSEPGPGLVTADLEVTALLI